MGENNFWNNFEVIDQVPTGERTVFQIAIGTHPKNGKDMIIYREFYNTKNDPTYHPSKFGGAFPVSAGIQAAKAFSDAIDTAFKRGMR